MSTKPVTVYAGTYGELTPLQQEGLDRVVDYLTHAIHPGPMVPSTCRIIIEWGDKEELEELRKC